MTTEENFMFGTLSATVRVESMPGARRIVAVEMQEDGSWRVCGSGVSNQDGVVEMAIEGHPASNIYAMALDDWGRQWASSMVVAMNDIVRPSSFKGWMYKCTQPGTLPEEEPEWWNAMAGIPQPVGTAMLQATRHYQPITHGPVDLTWDEAPSAPGLPTVIGEAIGGGFYVGDITVADGEVDDGVYAVIMGGLESQATLAWKTETTTTSGTSSLVNGLANTLDMEAANPAVHPAAMYCLNHDGGGYDDWYLPSTDELNLAWVNRTNLAELSMEAKQYWTSTQTAPAYAWYQYFLDGSRYDWGSLKSNSERVRPVRRIKKS